MEAILVAVLLLTAILFFTSVQRPQGTTEARGLDLGQVATDTLGILQRRTFTSSTTGDPEGWVTKVIGGDTATAQTVDDFLSQILPIGTKHVVRLSNGVGTIGLLPTASPGLPRGARAAEIPLFPHWQSFASNLTGTIAVAVPGMQVTSGVPYQFTDPAGIACIQSPAGSVTGPSGDAWASATYWKAALGRIPTWAPYGVWKGGTGTSGGACTGTPTYLAVGLPTMHAITDGSVAASLTTLTSASGPFTQDDVGRLVLGANFPALTRITVVTSATQVTLSKSATAGSNLAATIIGTPNYPIYGLQLVVWFGA